MELKYTVNQKYLPKTVEMSSKHFGKPIRQTGKDADNGDWVEGSESVRGQIFNAYKYPSPMPQENTGHHQ